MSLLPLAGSTDGKWKKMCNEMEQDVNGEHIIGTYRNKPYSHIVQWL